MMHVCSRKHLAIIATKSTTLFMMRAKTQFHVMMELCFCTLVNKISH